ncbi:MAG: mannose-1-phosphate guanylyltransferase/mannose-6-phosphate isomerase, partial [Pseudomonadota bacterium]
MLIPVILSGGAGSRLWPLSREHYPKQLLALTEHHTMLQATVERLSGIGNLAAPIIVCNEIHRFLVAEQMREIDAQPSHILLEPVGRNTAPAIAIAALTALKIDANATLLVLPADHLIQDQPAFHKAIRQAENVSAKGYLATFGIQPTHPETGYGYIRAGETLDDSSHRVACFVEKPDLATAESYLKTGEYYWNSGMFLFRAQRYLDELVRHAPKIHEASQAAFNGLQVDEENDFYRVDEVAFVTCPSDSIDYAVMEHTDSAAITPLGAGWNDIGAWSALWEVGAQDENKNVVQGDVVIEDATGCYLRAEHRLLAAIGVKDLVVVETADAVMVAHREQVQDVKKV